MEQRLLSEEEQEIVRRGLAAADLLGNPTFIEVIKSLMYETFCQFTETRPEEQTTRENIYNMYLGLQAIERDLNSRVQQKDALERSLNAEQQTQGELF